ncbi:MAG: hypothetical protein SFV19_16685 [Rhodospirillaceae bacterium]|nr:hypothetical protein [Rhodospirillaceae bacterium]
MAESRLVTFNALDALKQLNDFTAQHRWAEAESLAREILKVAPKRSWALVALAVIFENTGRHAEAIELYDKALIYHPSGLAFTKRGTSMLRRYWGPPPRPRARRPGPRVTCSQLGMNGRFGNQLLQYAFTRLYAHKCGIEAEFPDWVGRDLFDLDDPLIKQSLPPISEDDVDVLGVLSGRVESSLIDHDVFGYFQRNSADYAAYRNEFIRLFNPGKRAAVFTKAWQAGLDNHTVIALHLRRGDYGAGPFWIAPEQWYNDWLLDIWPKMKSPLLFIATDDRSVLTSFKQYDPMTSVDLGAGLPGAEFFCDFFVLTQADALAISNSSFSFTAAMLNTRATDFFRPEKLQEKLVRFDPWNAEIMLRYPS